MKVTNNKIGGPATAKTEGAKSSKAEATGGAAKPQNANALGARDVKGDTKVDVSERAQMMQKAKEIASQAPSVDEAKVARLQKMIDEGSYKVDADKIADRLMDEHMLIPD